MNAILKIIATCMLVQLLPDIGVTGIPIKSENIKGAFMEPTSVAYNATSNYVVAKVTRSPTNWNVANVLPNLPNRFQIISPSGGALFASNVKEGTRRLVFAGPLPDHARNNQEDSYLWDIENGTGDLVYYRNVALNEYLCSDKNARKVENSPIIFTLPASKKENCRWLRVLISSDAGKSR